MIHVSLCWWGLAGIDGSLLEMYRNHMVRMAIHITGRGWVDVVLCTNPEYLSG